MNAPKAERKKGFYGKGMSKPVVLSVLLHVFVVVIGTVGLPYFITPKEPVEMAITVEIAPLAALSQTNVRAAPQKAETEEPKPPPKSKPEPPKPTPPQPEEPDILSPREPEDVPAPPEEPVEEPKEPVKKPDPKPVVKPPIKPKPPQPEKKKDPPKKEEPKKEEPKKQEESIESLLNDLLPPEQSTPTENNNETKEVTEPLQTSQIADFSKELTASELDDLNRGVQPCWYFDAGARNAEELVVSLRVFLNPDMSVKEAEIMDQMRYHSDDAFRTAADKARWALLNAQCSKLRLPREKYEQWKEFIYHFDPRQML